jgi:hypothetical protein
VESMWQYGLGPLRSSSIYDNAIEINPIFTAYSSYTYYKPECDTQKCTTGAYGSTPRSDVPL